MKIIEKYFLSTSFEHYSLGLCGWRFCEKDRESSFLVEEGLLQPQPSSLVGLCIVLSFSENLGLIK